MTTLTDEELPQFETVEMTDAMILGWLQSIQEDDSLDPDDRDSAKQTAARFRELLAQQEWQPIETAPKDGTLIVIREQSGRVQIAAWGEPGYNKPSWWIQLSQLGTFNEYPTTKVTHWRPLPPPPKDG